MGKRKKGSLFGGHRHGTRRHPMHKKQTFAELWHRDRRLRLLYFGLDRLFLEISVGSTGSSPRRAKTGFRERGPKA
jgi:hypothetical protein